MLISHLFAILFSQTAKKYTAEPLKVQTISSTFYLTNSFLSFVGEDVDSITDCQCRKWEKLVSLAQHFSNAPSQSLSSKGFDKGSTLPRLVYSQIMADHVDFFCLLFKLFCLDSVYFYYLSRALSLCTPSTQPADASLDK